MNQIPLYDPHCQLPPPTLQELHKTHWRKAQLGAQEFLAEWLGVENGGGVLLFDRATHALSAAIEDVTDWQGPVLVPRDTYRAAWDAAYVVECQTMLYAPDVLLAANPGVPATYIPTWLYGQRPLPLVPRENCWNVHDCAHVCYPGMFKGWLWDRTMAVLSFFPTKPCGAFGGGALIGHWPRLRELESRHFPLDPKHRCAFTYPATIQSWGIMERCRLFEWDDWRRQQDQYHDLSTWLSRFGFESRAATCAVTPHLLPFKRTPELEALCKRAGLETGQHYPDLLTGEVTNITIPFWTPEVLERLKANI